MKKVKPIPFKRKRLGKTNYYKRLKLLMSNKPRVTIRSSLNYINVQLVEFNPDGDKVITAVNSRKLSDYGWGYSTNNMPSAYLTGLLFGTKVKSSVKEAIVDIGLKSSIKGSKIYAVIKGVLDAGVGINCPKEILPDERRINGTHIAEYAKKIKQNKDEYNKQFSRYIKNNKSPEDITKEFEHVKNKILSAKK